MGCEAVLRKCVSLALLVCLLPASGASYSVLTHEQIVDLLWKDRIQPLLEKKYPGASEDDLRKAHAFAYGGSLVQDMGYYPFGSKYFSDLVHYVRTGDFVEALIEQSTDRNEYAFALGALAHYASDVTGHPTINRVVAISFPKLGKKYGDHVTYAQDPKAHIRAEFGFDMVQVAKNRYTSDRYHDFIGFEVSKPLLERAFEQTYGLKLSDVFGDEDLAIGTFRRSIAHVLPEITRVALLSRRQEMVKETPNFKQKEFLYHLSRTNYEKSWGKGYRKPGVGTRVLAFFLRIIPKVGPFKALAFKIPTTQTEDLYIKSIDKTVDDYGVLLKQTKNDKIDLPDMDCDTGKPTEPGEYSLADKAYAHLLDDHSKHDFAGITPDLRENILKFYADAQPAKAKKDQKNWQKTMDELAKLKQHPASEPPRAGQPSM